MSRLKTYVHVTEVDADGKPTGRAQWFGPEHDVPEWAMPYIDNPKVWAADEPDITSAKATPAVRPAVAPPAPALAVDATKPPPRGGAGSGRAEWAAYATAKGVDVTEDLKSRDDIIAAIELAGIPIE